MLKNTTPNRVLVAIVVALTLYWVLGLVVDPILLRDFFNSLCFGLAAIITITWGGGAMRAVRRNLQSGEWMLVLAVFSLWATVLAQRLYVMVFNYYGRPDSWANSSLGGLWPYCYAICGFMFLVSPEIQEEGMSTRSVWWIIAAVAVGSGLTGFLLGASVSTV